MSSHKIFRACLTYSAIIFALSSVLFFAQSRAFADGKNMGFNMANCHILTLPSPYPPPVDNDWDWFSDECEYQLASAFAPQLLFHQNEYWRERQEAWAVSYATVNGQPGVAIIYLLGYHNDMDHTGDSEFIELYLHNTSGNTWVLVGAYLSAHWSVQWPFDRSEAVYYNDLEYANGEPYRGRPRIWVARGKHANYKHIWNCTSNPIPFIGGDDCGAATAEILMVHPERNIGSDWNFQYGSALLDCTTSMPPYTYLNGIECYWTWLNVEAQPPYNLSWSPGDPVYTNKFFGWVGQTIPFFFDYGVTGYHKILYERGWKSNYYENPPPNLRTWPEPPPPPPSPLSAQILGPETIVIWEPSYCSWSAYTSGGSGTKSYSWRKNGVLVGTASEWTLQDFEQSGFSLSLTVSDDSGSVMASLWVQVLINFNEEDDFYLCG